MTFTMNIPELLHTFHLPRNATPLAARVRVNRGDTYRILGRYDQARADFDRALRINPASARAYHGRARLLFETRDYARAIDDMRRALDLA